MPAVRNSSVTSSAGGTRNRAIPRSSAMRSIWIIVRMPLESMNDTSRRSRDTCTCSGPAIACSNASSNASQLPLSSSPAALIDRLPSDSSVSIRKLSPKPLGSTGLTVPAR